jgi:hypothetical protein
MHTDLGRAWWQWGKPEQAAAALLSAARVSPASFVGAEEVPRAADLGAQGPLAQLAVEAYVEGSGDGALCPQAGGEAGGVEAVAFGDEDAEFMAAEGVGACEVVDTY